MRKYIKNTAFLGFALFSIFAIVSCEVGLGASVDTERPALSITYPPKGSIIMDTFTLAGTVADDIGVSYVNVTLTHKTLKKEFVYKSEDGAVTIEAPAGGWSKGTRWTASIGKKDETQNLYNGWDLPDGEYFIDVEASDGVGSVYDRRSIRIDNTAPVFISENLTSLGNAEKEKVSTFGQKINLSGQAKDDSEILKVFFDIYDQNKVFKGSKSLDYEMTSEGILLAKYSSVLPSTETEKILAENYNLIYGLEEGEVLPEKADENDIRHPYLVIRFADNARVYNKPVFEGEESEISGLGDGNISSELFLNTPAFGDEGITIDELNNYQKRLNLNASMDAKISNIAESSIAYTKAGEINNFNKVNKILIDPEINPKWNIDSYDQTSSDFNQAYLDSGLTVMFACGNDNTEFLPENICILLERVEETGNGTGLFTSRVKTDAEIKAWAEAWTDSSKDTADLIMLKETGVRSDGKVLGTLETAYVHDIKLDSPKLVVHQRYRIVVLGKDGSNGNGLDFSEQNRSWYGFHATKETAAPEIKFKSNDIAEPWVEAKNAEGAWLGPDTENFVLEFQVTTSGEAMAEEYPKVTYALADNNGALVEEAAGKYDWQKELISDTNSVYVYKWTLESADRSSKLWMPAAEGNYKLVFTVEAKDKADGNTTVNYKLNIDRKNPVVNIKDVSPYIEDENSKILLNGKVTIPVSVSDAKGVAKAEYSIQWDAVNSDSAEIELDSENSGVIVLDTTSVNNKDVTLKVTASDIFGNTKTEEKIYYVDQESDRPKIDINLNETENPADNSFGLSSGNTITVTVTDDDGTNDNSCLKVKVWGVGENGTELISDWKNLPLENGKTVWNFYDSGVITKDGKYKLQFEATDKIGNLTTSKTESAVYAILVDGTAPKFDSDVAVKIGTETPYKENGKYYVPAGKSVKISFAMEEGNLHSLKAGATELKNTKANCDLKSGSTTDWNVNYTWTPAADETSGDKSIVFTATDDSQNSKSLTVNLYYDKDFPSLSDENIKISPVLNTNTVNGILYVEGKATDNDKVVKVKGKVNYTDRDGSSKTDSLFLLDAASFGKPDPIEIDTTKYKDGTNVKISLTAVDRAGNESTEYSKTYSINQDSDRPVLTVGLNTSGNPADNHFKLVSDNTVTVSVSDDDGLNNATALKVKAWGFEESAGSAVWKTIPLENGKVTWNFKETGVITADGKYKVQFEVTDKIGNLATSKTESAVYAILVDGTAPDFAEEVSVSVNGTARTKESGKYYVPKDKAVNIGFSLKEENLKSVKVGGNAVSVTGSEPDWNVKYIWSPASGETAGDKSIVFSAEDISGNTKTKEIKLYYDTQAPSISEDDLKIYPVLNTNKVNGIIYVEGKATDNDKVAKVTGTVVYKNKTTGNEETKEFFTSEGSVFGKAEVVKIDTTEFKDNTEVKVMLTVFDRAGNSALVTKTYSIDQSTDKPVISFDTSKFDPSLTSFDAVESAVNKNMFGLNTNNILTGTVTDDDGVGYVTVSVAGTTKEVTYTGKTTFNCNIKDDLGIDAAGNYVLKINAGDDTSKTKLSSANTAETQTLYIVVDGVAPEIRNEKVGTETYTSGIPVNGDFKLSFDILEAHLSQVTVQVNEATAVTVVRTSFDSNTGISHFEETLALNDEDKDSTLSVKIYAKDVSGLEAEKELNINYDATVPEINTTITKLLSGNKVNGSITISGTVKDEAGSGVAEGTTVKLYAADGREVNVLEAVSGITNSDTSFTYSIDTPTKLTDGASYSLKVNAKDKAGNSAVEKVISFTVDQSTDLPTITFVNANTDPDNLSVFGSSGWTIDFAAEDDDGDVEVYIGEEKITSPYTIPESLRTSGEHTVTFVVKEAYAENLASPKTAPVPLTFAVDTKSPEFVSQTLNGATYYDGVFVSGDYDIVFKVDDDNGVEKFEYKSGETWISTDISYSVDKKTITHSYTGQTTKSVETEYRLTDKYGYTSTKTLKYKVDNADPSITDKVILVESADYDSNKWFDKSLVNIAVSGVKDENLSRTVNVTGSSAAEGESFVMTVVDSVSPKTGSFSQTRTFEDGINEVKYIFADEAGNTKEIPVTVKVDTTAPTVSQQKDSDENNIPYLSSGVVITGAATVKVNFKASDGTSGSVSGLDSAVLGPKANFTDSEKYGEAISLTSTDTVTDNEIDFNAKFGEAYIYAEGKHEIWVRVTDKVGNASETKLGEFILDRTLPKVEYTSHTENATVNKTITLSGTVKDENWGETPQAVLKSGEDQIGEAVALTGNGKIKNWSFEINTADFKDTENNFFVGSKEFLVEVADAAGLKSTDIRTLNIDQDSDRPAITLDTIKTDGSSTLAGGTISGTVTDDDGVSSFAILVERKNGDNWTNVETENIDASGFKTVTPTDGRFSYTVPSYGEGDASTVDGSYRVYFKVQDTEQDSEEYFETTDNDRQPITLTPRVYTRGNSTPVTTGVNFDIDGTAPSIDSVQVQVSSDNTHWGAASELATGVHYGGPNRRYAKLSITGSDNVLAANALKVYVSVSGTKTGPITYSSGYTHVIDFNRMESGSVPIEVIVEDNSGQSAQKAVSVSCDNSAPSDSNAIDNMTPVSDDEVTGVVAISGTVNDDDEANSGINNVKYYVPVKNGTTTETVPADWSGYASKWKDTGVTLTDIVLRINLDGLSENTNINSAYAGYETYTGSEVYQIPVWFRVEDNCGNVTYVTDKSIRYNPNAARPKIKRTYPTVDSANMGGIIRMAGTAEDDVDIDSIYVQYDVDGDGFDADDAIWLKGKGYKIYNAQTGTEIAPVSADTLTDVTWGVKAEGTRSWNAEFDASSLATNTNLKIRMIARDKDQNTLLSAWSQPVLSITVNNDLPQFSQFYLVQYEEEERTTEKLRVLYESDKFIKGENWCLEGSVTDNANISRIEQKANERDAGAELTLNDSDKTSDEKGYNLKLNITVEGGKTNFSTIIKATNGNTTNPGSQEQKFSVNIDNEAPAFEDGRSDNDLVLYAGDYGKTRLDASFLQNSNGYTTISGKINEPGSGFKRAVFYVERFESKTAEGTYKNRRLYNVMTGGRIDLTNDSSEAVSGAPTFVDGLPVSAEIDITKGSNNRSFTVGDGVLNDNIRVGGLVIIGNVYNTITGIDTTNKKIEVSDQITSAWESNNTQKARFVYAFIVDNSNESRNTNGSEKGGDGDGLVENYTKSGTNYTWEVSFDSSVIPDGPATVHVVVFDVAGNSRHGTVTTRVANNAPRITSVRLGTDLNKSGTVQTGEYTKFYAYKNNWGEGITDQGKDVWNLIPSNETESKDKNWKIVSSLNVIPEFVGGNGNIHYVFSKETGTGVGKRLEAAETGTATSFTTIDSTTKERTVNAITLNNDTIDSTGEDGVNTYRFSFWDSTEESTPGTDSGSCVLNVELYQDLVDDTDPTATVSPFFWNKRKAGNNSVAWDTTDVNKPLGHIELEADWRSAAYDYSEETKAYTIKSNYSSLDAKLKDLDPKVSGTIVIRGTAYDETVLNKLVVTFDGIINGTTTKCESTYTASSGTWSTPTGIGFTLKVEDSEDGVSQDGHFVNWELTLDTSKISGQTGLDKKVHVKAIDKAVSGTSRESADASYQMDIVPYVTEVVTSLSSMKETNPSVYNRTATGHYPVQSVVSNVATGTLNNSASESTTLKGFNLNGTVEVDGDSNPTVSEGQIQISAATLYSKALDCKVNGIPLMNNLNNNNASGSYKGKKNSSDQLVPVSDSSADYDELYTYAYNRVPNGDNNNRLTDDIIFDVWEFNDRVVEPSFNSIGGTTMKVNSHNGLIQYAYSDGTIFAMASSANDRNGQAATSSTSWVRGWDTVQEPSVGFHVDASGQTVGAGHPSDTSDGDIIDAYALMTSRWGFGFSISSTGFMQSNTNMKILETTGETVNNKTVIYRQRFQSTDFASTTAKKNEVDSVNLYMVYYDAMHNEVRFRAGFVPEKDGDVYKNGAWKQDWGQPNKDAALENKTNSGSDPFDMYMDTEKTVGQNTWDDNSYNNIAVPDYGTKRLSQVIASSSISGKGAGQYTSVAVSKNASSQDVVSAVWFDSTANALRYSYIVDPMSQIDTLKVDTGATSWTGNKTLFSGAGGGEYCQIAADANGGLHVVAYAGNGYLYYAYAPGYNADFTECIVDATDGVGQHATLDVALNSDGNPIPYIGYYSTTGKAKHAYLTAAAAAALGTASTPTAKQNALAGVDDNMSYTGAWETSIIPSVNALSVRREDKINVGVWKYTAAEHTADPTKVEGAIKNSTAGTSTFGEQAFTMYLDNETDLSYNRNYSITYGNGTSNAVLLYQIMDSKGTYLNCLESAQLRGSE